MVSFRVSADDAPILSKQFEPQFLPGDFLQMHNRDFVINMVINGEKAPAFNASTLTLPTPQVDNTGRIIENTRNRYSRPRSKVETEIEEAIKVVVPPNNNGIDSQKHLISSPHQNGPASSNRPLREPFNLL
jgi:hypothetical protein